MRDVYYQSVGNPVQFDRLPATRPVIEMLPVPMPRIDGLKQIAATVTAAALGALFTFITYRPPGWSWLEPYDLLFALPVILFILGFTLYSMELRWLLQPAFLAALALLCLNHRTPWGCQVILAAGAVALFTYAFGRHWTRICTAAPLPRTTADTLRANWDSQLIVLSGIAALLAAALLLTGIGILKLAVLTLPLAAVFIPAPNGLCGPRWRVFAESFLSWFTFKSRPLPGLLQSPIGDSTGRCAFTVFAAVLTAVLLIRIPDSPVFELIQFASDYHDSVLDSLEQREAGRFEQFRYGALTWLVTFAAVLLIPVVLPFTIAISLSAPVLLEAAAQRDQAGDKGGIQPVLEDIQRSPDLLERNSVYLGRVVQDGSPLLVPRRVFAEHAHGLGDSGAGKTSLFLCPVIEQLGMTGECSIIVLDLKADTLELLAALQVVAESVRRQRGVHLPLRVFSNQADRATFAFNPLTQPFWSKFDLLTRTDILCGANGLTYGTDYGQGYFSSANAAILHHTLKTFPHLTTFTELAEQLGEVIVTAKKRELHPEIRKAGVHVQEVIKRLAHCPPLNATGSTAQDPEVGQQAIDLAQVFQQPQLLYFHLSATLSPAGAPEIARLVNYMLLAAATQTERKVPVYLVIDEFQRMVASNLEYMLQLARSMGVGVILANQSMEDLKKSATNLIPAIEANCRLRQWFSVSSSDDQKRLINGSGLTIDHGVTHSVSRSADGRETVSRSESERTVDRFTMNDVLLTSDHRFRSFLHLKRGDGYAQFGGMPVIIETGYHISADEYRRRKALPWPSLRGSFVPNADRPDYTAAPKPDTGPHWTEEVIGEPQTPLSQQDADAIDSLFDKFRDSFSSDESDPGDQ